MNKRQAWNINTLFAVFLFGFTIASILKPDRGFSERENRVLKQMPDVNTQDILSGSFEEDYEEYLSDQFFLRDEWIALRTMAQRATLHEDVHGVYFGKDGYLIERHEDEFDTDLARTNADTLIHFANEAAERYPGHVTVMIVPNSVEILKDKLPYLAPASAQSGYIKLIESGLKDSVFFDAAQVLQKNSADQMYYRTDHHWTTDGAFCVFASWMMNRGIDIVGKDQYTVTEVTDSFEGTVAAKVGIRAKADTIRIYEKKDGASYALIYNRSDDVRHTVYQTDLLEGRDKYAVFYGGNYGLIEGETNAGTGRRILVIKDSYAHCFVPFLYDYFDEVDMIDLRYFHESLSKYMEEGEYTDILFLENAAGFAEDMSIAKLLA